MDINSCPVGLDELKRHLRIFDDMVDSDLQMLLFAAVEYIQNFTLINFEKDYPAGNIPFALRAAILMTAGRLFETPADAVFNLPTQAMDLANSYKRWERVKLT